MSTPSKKIRKPFEPSRQASAENPLPNAVYDRRGFRGNKPKVVSREPDITPPPPAVRGVQGSVSGERSDDSGPVLKLGRRIVTDVRETIDDIQDEPGEVPHRIRERVKSYLPRWHSQMKENR